MPKQSPAQQNKAQAATFFIAICVLAGVSACTPAFNWREVAFEGLPVAALLPCKPDRATRMVPLAGAPRAMVMAGCKAADATFTVAVVQLDDAGQVALAQQALKAVNKATHSQYAHYGAVLVQASVYGLPTAGRAGPGAQNAQALETFFSGVKLTAKP